MRFSFLSTLSAGLIVVAAASAADLALSPANDAKVFNIPKVDKINIDGDGSDWGERGFKVNALPESSGKIRPMEQFDAAFRLGWDERGLLLFVRVIDNTPIEDGGLKSLFLKDSIELLLAPDVGSFERIHVVISPGVAPDRHELRKYVFDYRTKPELKTVKVEVGAARVNTGGWGYTLEALLPWDCLGIVPEIGREVAFQICVNDYDGAKLHQANWYPQPIIYQLAETRKTQRLRLSSEPSSPVLSAAAGGYERFRRTRIGIIAPVEMAGKVAMVSEGEQVLGSVLIEKDGERASGNIKLYMPPLGKSMGPMSVFTVNNGQHLKKINEGALLANFTLPSPEIPRREAFSEVGLVFKPSVFTTDYFPRCDFEQPTYVEDLIGPYTLKTTYYDADYNEVKQAKKPGRYGAITEIKTESGEVFKRFSTLYRQPVAFNWRKQDLPFSFELPKEMGIDPQVAKEQSFVISEHLKERLAEEFTHSNRGAVLFAGLHETKPGASVVKRTSVWENDRRWWAGLQKKTGDLKHNFLIFLPEDYEKDTQRQWPLMLFLHGSGERGEDLDRLRAHGPPKLVQTRKDFPFIMVAPQCPMNSWWSPAELGDLLDQVEAKYRVDKDREYCTGISMGGYGTWAMALEYPSRFAAIVPICGGSDPADAERIKDLPIWNFHGGKDGAVPIRFSEEMVAALKKLGSDVKFTVYPEAEHDSWTQTYNNEEVFQWLLQHKRNK